ncbi:MAG: hypothetical protein IPN15_13765 [Saprospiraceae bacterium]|nr:hypothetical protein [Candidatus Vicinibacter affinis]
MFRPMPSWNGQNRHNVKVVNYSIVRLGSIISDDASLSELGFMGLLGVVGLTIYDRSFISA